jgi:hypothetical protein
MIIKMFLRSVAFVALVAAVCSMGCGTSTTFPNGGSKAQTMTGVSPNGYPPDSKPKDAESPALGSSSEQKNSDAGKPKVGDSDGGYKPKP